MNIELKSSGDIAKMRLGGKIAGKVLLELKNRLKEGITTSELDKIAEKLILGAGAKPSFKGYCSYPGSVCISVNDEVVHGLPGSRALKNGDLVSLDVGVYYQGFHSDTALTAPVGKITSKAQKLLDVTLKALKEGIKECRIGNHLGDVQAAVQRTVENEGFGIVKDLAGHGIGRKLQEAPSISNFGKTGSGPKLLEGMTLAIEPMVAAGDWHVKVLEDGWTVVTLDGSLSAHFEHTVAITKNGPKILTI